MSEYTLLANVPKPQMYYIINLIKLYFYQLIGFSRQYCQYQQGNKNCTEYVALNFLTKSTQRPKVSIKMALIVHHELNL